MLNNVSRVTRPGRFSEQELFFFSFATMLGSTEHVHSSSDLFRETVFIFVMLVDMTSLGSPSTVPRGRLCFPNELGGRGGSVHVGPVEFRGKGIPEGETEATASTASIKKKS